MLYKQALAKIAQIFLEVEGLMPGNHIESFAVTDDRGGTGTLQIDVRVAKPDGTAYLDQYVIHVSEPTNIHPQGHATALEWVDLSEVKGIPHYG